MSDNTKIMTAKEAVGKFVHDGDVLTIGGFVTNRRPYGLVYEILRRGIKNLYLEGGPSGGDMDMLIGCNRVHSMMVSYIANSGYTQVSRRFRAAVEAGELLIDDFSLDVQTIIYHAAAMGLPYVPMKNMLGSDLIDKWGISKEIRKNDPKLPNEKYIIQDNPFIPGDKLVLVPVPQIDVALIHAQAASPDGTVRIVGAPFQDLDIAMAAKYTIVSCEELLSDEEIRKHPELNTISGLCIDAVVPMEKGAHPSQCFGHYDYDSSFYLEYDKASRTKEDFDEFMDKYVFKVQDQKEYLEVIGKTHLDELVINPEYGYVPGLKRR